MIMKPRIRKLVLTLHIITSIGWIGAVVSYLILAIVGLKSLDVHFVRSDYILSNSLAWQGILPLALASFISGIVCSLGTKWGLFRYRWVVAKLLLTLFATIILLTKMAKINSLAKMAETGVLTASNFMTLRNELAFHAMGGIFVLIVITIIAVYKPKGLTRYGRRKLQEDPRNLSIAD